MTAIHHLALTASDLPRSSKFYTSLLEAIGVLTVLEDEDIWGWEKEGFELLLYAAKKDLKTKSHEIYQPGFHHIAFKVSSCGMVDDAAAKMANYGGQILGGPVHFPDYPGDYYAVFGKDPDGLKLEVMCN